MTRILEFVHNTESPILSYNSEIELSAVGIAYNKKTKKHSCEIEVL